MFPLPLILGFLQKWGILLQTSPPQSNMAMENTLFIGDCPIEPQWNEWISNCHVWLPEGNMILYSVCTASIVLLVYYIKFSPKKNMVVFHSYVWLPEGKSPSNPIKPQFSFGFPHMCDVTKGRGAKPATLRHGSAWSPVMGQRCDSGIPCIDR